MIDVLSSFNMMHNYQFTYMQHLYNLLLRDHSTFNYFIYDKIIFISEIDYHYQDNRTEQIDNLLPTEQKFYHYTRKGTLCPPNNQKETRVLYGVKIGVPVGVN
jgi:hypothetical protein